MLKTTIDLIPFGIQSPRTIATVWIANHHSDYVYLIYVPVSSFNDEIKKHGLILNHDRSEGVTKLLSKVLLDDGESACGLSQKYAEYWLEEGL